MPLEQYLYYVSLDYYLMTLEFSSIFVLLVTLEFLISFYQVTLECNVFQSNQQLWRNRVDILVDEFQEKVPPHPFNQNFLKLREPLKRGGSSNTCSPQKDEYSAD